MGCIKKINCASLICEPRELAKSAAFRKQIFSVKSFANSFRVDRFVESETELEGLVHGIAFACCDNL